MAKVHSGGENCRKVQPAE